MPLDPRCAVIVYHTIESMKYEMTQLILGTHQGTHLDAPAHFLKKGLTVDKLDLSKCIGPAEVLDFARIGPRHSLTPEDLGACRRRITPGSRILLRTDWWRKFPQKEYFSDGPMISPRLARWLVRRKILMLGVETPGVHPSQWEEVHKIFLRAGVVIVEGLAHLNKLRRARVFFIAAPLKIKGRDGSPVRAVAIEDMGGVPRSVGD
jgi:kynurenine formamidase